MIFTILSVILILAGLIFFLGAAVGVVRFPDFYTRMHAAGKGDTLSSLLVLLGFSVYQLRDFQSFSESWIILLVILKLIAISTFFLITSPTSTHALMDAGWEDKVKPEIAKGRSNHLEEDAPKR
ncbi:monovalent cation/H(+) antiporter subunit G [Verrucomicrobiales bacterium]|jgi:multicomponent Na+:H+ antiporter subunit G|nr:monovalent cation/H(+) antiporter subunit G [Verrucomicrobiales bacterium]MDA7926599.1 monovalent cation/H(+) antiporter subunit G [Verrucomicrobiales bacterium]|tara:strand:- start:217 stop:588 length:372 start_codon:yes stop_codon:yes gene_type:complete